MYGLTCIACGKRLVWGDRYYPDESGGFVHADCCGPERESYVNADGDPLGPNDPIPESSIWDEGDDDELTALSTPSPEREVKEALNMTGLRTIAEVIDMANVGQSLMENIALLKKAKGPFNDWTPADDPAEIVFDLVNHYEDAAEAEPVLQEARAAVAFLDKVRGASQAEQIAVGHDHWDRAEAVLRAVAGLYASPVPVAISREDLEEVRSLLADVKLGATRNRFNEPAHYVEGLDEVREALDAILQRLSNQQKEG